MDSLRTVMRPTEIANQMGNSVVRIFDASKNKKHGDISKYNEIVAHIRHLQLLKNKLVFRLVEDIASETNFEKTMSSPEHINQFGKHLVDLLKKIREDEKRSREETHYLMHLADSKISNVESETKKNAKQLHEKIEQWKKYKANQHK